MKFATKLTVTMSGILIFFAAIVSYVVYKSSIENLENQIKGRQTDTAQHIMDKVDRMLFERFADIKAIASDPIVSSRDSTPRQIRERLSEFRNHFKTYISLSLFDLNRVRIADTSGLSIGVQHQLEGYWKDVLKEKDFIMDVSMSASLRRTVFHFAFPVKDKSGETFGTVVTRMPVSKLYYVIREIGRIQTESKELQTDLIDKDGLLLYSNYNRKGILKDNLSDWQIVRNSLASQEISTGRFTHGGIEDIYVFVHEQGYLDFKGNDWSLLVRVPIKIAFAPAVKLRNTMFSILVAMLVFIVLILLLLSRTLTKPIIKLRDATIRIGKGDRNIKLDINTKDEIGELANSFIQMNNNLLETTVSRNELIEEISERKQVEEELKVLNESLERRVDERTKKLVEKSEKLMSEIVKREQVEEQIKASLKEKEVLLNEVHHRVKNNLQIISSLLDMGSMQTHNQEVIDLIIDCRNRINSIALVHSQLYKNERLNQIDMGKHIQELSKRLLQIYEMEKTITLDIKPTDISLPITRAVPCALALNELISNTLKHAYKDGQKGKIDISMQRSDGDTFSIKVKDDGIGIPEEIDIDKTNSLGLSLVRNLVLRQLSGKLYIRRNRGTEIVIEFKALKGEIRHEQSNVSRR
ncbi:MAG TPA: HAMP domain-containing protein [Candidatus Scalindua sp.]|nr:HAMP domain-containing protein [Candidatus Scalindua sp.]